MNQIKKGFLQSIGFIIGISVFGLTFVGAYQFIAYQEVQDVGSGSGLTSTIFNQLTANVRLHETAINKLKWIDVDLNNTTEVFDKKCRYKVVYLNCKI